MIVTELYNGQGLGNQLWCYVTTRVIAKNRGFTFGIKSPEKFKGRDFMNLDFGQTVVSGTGPEGGPAQTLPEGITHYYNERKITHPLTDVDIRTHDERLVAVPDNTKIDGIMQDEQYIRPRRDEIRQWLRVKPEHDCRDWANDDTCIINFRGGEYVHTKNVFLPQQYWDDAVRQMRTINDRFKFVVVTDDVKTAKQFFPKFDVFHFNIAKDYAVIRNAHYLILSNSSFAFFPAWLNENLKYCIAPKYWSQYNTSDGFWGTSYNLTKGWHYLDRRGAIGDYDACRRELDAYMTDHPEYYAPTKIEKNFLVVSSYNNDLGWVPESTDNYHIYDRSESSVIPYMVNREKVTRVPNVGYNIYDYCTFIIDNYDRLPECVIFTKGNVFPRHVSQAFFNRLANNDSFTPIEDHRRHRVYWPVCFFSSDGGFCEINNSWYLAKLPIKYFRDYNDFLRFCYRDPVIPWYVRFAPGGCYVVPRANILKLPKVAYENLRTFVSHAPLPGEAHIIERALHTLWTANFELNEALLNPVDPKRFTLRASRPSLKQRIGRRLTGAISAALGRIVR